MNRCVYQQRNAMGGYEEIGFDAVVCPKPRRLGALNPSINDQIRPLRLHPSPQTDIGESKAGSDLLDMILTKGEKFNNHMASSPPFFCGSPPSRVSNPVIQDAQFGRQKATTSFPTPSSPRLAAGGCVRMKYSDNPAAVRIEGFDCLNIDRRNRSISAMA